MQCARCFKDFKYIEKHKKCVGKLPITTQKEKFPSLKRFAFGEKPTYSSKLRVGFAMLSGECEG